MSGAKRSVKHEKLARIYDEEILPIWAHRFGRMMLRGLELPPKAQVLDVACGTGYPASEVLRKMDDQSRLIAIDSSSAMLDVARRKLADGGKRLFFRTESAFPRLSFANDVYDLVLCNLGLSEADEPEKALRDFVRVAKPGGLVVCTLPLAGTWGELYDIYREVLVKHDKHETLARLEQHLARYPAPEDIERWMTRAGLTDPRLDIEEFSLLFRSSREFFFAPLIEYGPLPVWKDIAGKGQEMQDVFWYIKQAIDAYFGDRAFQITVKAGCLRGKKGEAGADLVVVEPLDRDEDWISVQTGEVEVVSLTRDLAAAAVDSDSEASEIDALRDDRPADAGEPPAGPQPGRDDDPDRKG
jgi:ubiquinone/menaquinone biosynthesis C-methylase UbiE